MVIRSIIRIIPVFVILPLKQSLADFFLCSNAFSSINFKFRRSTWRNTDGIMLIIRRKNEKTKNYHIKYGKRSRTRKSRDSNPWQTGTFRKQLCFLFDNHQCGIEKQCFSVRLKSFRGQDLAKPQFVGSCFSLDFWVLKIHFNLILKCFFSCFESVAVCVSVSLRCLFSHFTFSMNPVKSEWYVTFLKCELNKQRK